MRFICFKTCIFVLSFKTVLYDTNLIQGNPNNKSPGNSLFFLFNRFKQRVI